MDKKLRKNNGGGRGTRYNEEHHRTSGPIGKKVTPGGKRKNCEKKQAEKSVFRA